MNTPKSLTQIPTLALKKMYKYFTYNNGFTCTFLANHYLGNTCNYTKNLNMNINHITKMVIMTYRYATQYHQWNTGKELSM